MKQSDHRPVIAIIEVDIHQVNENKRNNVFREVIRDLGPPDATVIVGLNESCDDDNIFDDEFMNALVQNLSEIGEIILVRFVSDTIWITFRDGRSALAAVQKGVIKIDGHTLQLTLKTPDWISCIEKEINIFKDIENNDKHEEYLDSTVTKFENLSATDENFDLVYSSKLPPPRPSPPARPPQPSLGTNIKDHKESEVINETNTTTASAIYEEISDNISRKIISNEILDDYLQGIKKFNSTKLTPPPLPSRHVPQIPMQIPPPTLATSSPPPVPARSTGGPPIPTRHNN